MSEVTGGCRCGQLRYRFKQSGPLLNYCCHCLDCQKTTGSVFADQVVVMAAGFATTGRHIDVVLERPSGGLTTHIICPDCQSRVSSSNDVYNEIELVRGGTLDDPAALDPFAHIWVKRKRAWIAVPDGVPQFEENASPAEFFALVKNRRGV